MAWVLVVKETPSGVIAYLLQYCRTWLSYTSCAGGWGYLSQKKESLFYSYRCGEMRNLVLKNASTAGYPLGGGVNGSGREPRVIASSLGRGYDIQEDQNSIEEMSNVFQL